MKKLFSRIPYSLVVCALVLAFFIPNLLKGKIPIPADSLNGLYHPFRDNSLDGYNPEKFPVKNPLITDPVLQTYPWRYQAVISLKQKSWPLWNPFNFSGQPLLGNLQSAPLQIGNIFFFLLNFKITWGLQIILPTILTALFMYLFLKDLKLSNPSAIFGAVILPFSGFFIAWMTWGNITTVAMYLPLILLCINKLWQKRSPFFTLVLTFAFFQTIVSGHAQTSLYVFLAAFVFTVFKFTHGRNFKSIFIILYSLIAAVFISMPQILPTLEFIQNSARSTDQAYYPMRQDWFIPKQNLIQLLAPDFFGNPATYNYWGVWNYAEFISYIGIIPLAFSVLAIARRKKETYFFLSLLILSLILALENPLSKLPYLLGFPFLSSLQPSRIIFLVDFSLVALAAFGLDFFLKERKTRLVFFLLPVPIAVFALFLVVHLSRGLFKPLPDIDTFFVASQNLIVPTAIALLFITFAALSKKISNKFLIIIILVVTLLDLFRFGYKFTPFSKLSTIFPQTKTTDYLSSQTPPFRIISTDRRIASGSSLSVYGIEAVNGYDPLYLNDYANFIQAWESEKVEKPGSFNRILTPQNYKSTFTDLINVKYILSFDELNDPNLEKVHEEGKTKVYLNKKVLPRAFFVNQVTRVQDREQELAFMLDKKFEPRQTAVSSSYAFPKQEINTKVDFLKYNNQSFELQATTDKDAPLIITNIDYPGWEAMLDGQKIQIQKVNYLFQSIIIPRGQHDVVFKFKPSSFYNGLYLALVGILLTIVQTIFLWRKKYLS